MLAFRPKVIIFTKSDLAALRPTSKIQEESQFLVNAFKILPSITKNYPFSQIENIMPNHANLKR
jgi:hypothetical protein